ncbi:hypothetical protein KFK09_026388 [Dendrobium nobile]|uniref:Transposase Tnp1/En/Spm-like domain-containing protein n=1 Tax=Dendrobium nobile TaxID=94219 RepID=A0A8T3A7P0_DENNO|nr:hypothetical protein KFK09_026388 [Dendrobium nobile]
MAPHTRTHVRNTESREETEVEIVVPTNTIENYVAGTSNEEQKRKRGPTYMCKLQLCNVPKRILKDQWKNLLSYWNSEESKVGTKVAVESVLDSTKTVAIGYIQSMDPTHMVGNYPLGQNWCSIHINIPVNWEEHLIRPYSTLTIIGHAIGTYVAWPQALDKGKAVRNEVEPKDRSGGRDTILLKIWIHCLFPQCTNST